MSTGTRLSPSDPSATSMVTTTNSRPSLEALRVAQGELTSGNTTGSVYTQLSNGAAFVLTDRSVALEKVATQIREQILREDEDEQPISSSSSGTTIINTAGNK